ncbi:MAG: 3-phosphoshikimate 1-carboxyvinyltransferase [Methanocorpusculum sp.]|uniref:3-phosphoshikimate 1-carboxyvinyltransferase n=1 Tax=Methanocorpusculum sp. TaxID=2058474 RepID=UPI002721247E|nr:3-phosphoshikimate 1-carboxyvinyltransferase [Methanocorpusculum sp.]MDO9522705.1 3-phosphoshikimate 1-carboxyvinyltransferase [Methanocorpusculum sp.]
MKLIVSSSRISGQVCAPPSKSHTHRAFLLAGLSKGKSVVLSPLLGEDTLATLDAVQALGANVCISDDRITIMGGDLHVPLPKGTVINCKNSGTSIRMLAGIASHLEGTTGFTGDSSLCSRPMKPLLDALSELGAGVTSENGCAPFTITGPASGGEVHIRGDVSSQFISALLISAPLGKTDTNIHLTTSLTSKPYVNMTISAMKKHGVSVETTDDGYLVRSGQVFSPVDVQVGGDYSSAAFLFAAAALTGEITVSGLDPADPQGDQVVISILETFGAVVIRDGEKVTVRKADLTSADIDLANAPDLFSIIAVLASQANGTSRLYGAAHLRFKESDRIMSTARFLRSMGADIQETEDGCIITGQADLSGTNVTTFGDHRIMMAAAVAGLIADGQTIIDDAGCCAVSYPGFVRDMQRLGADMREE